MSNVKLIILPISAIIAFSCARRRDLLLAPVKGFLYPLALADVAYKCLNIFFRSYFHVIKMYFCPKKMYRLNDDAPIQKTEGQLLWKQGKT